MRMEITDIIEILKAIYNFQHSEQKMNNICKVVGNGLLHNRGLPCTF